MKIAIKGRHAVLVEDDSLVQNSQKSYPAEFSFDKTWLGFTKTALFEAGAVNVAVVLSEDRCSIPGECLKQAGVTLRVGVYGVKGEERMATVWCQVSKVLPACVLDVGQSDPSQPMPDDLYQQIMSAIGDLGAAGFEGKTLAEAIGEIKTGIADTATDAEVDSILDGAFGTPST